MTRSKEPALPFGQTYHREATAHRSLWRTVHLHTLSFRGPVSPTDPSLSKAFLFCVALLSIGVVLSGGVVGCGGSSGAVEPTGVTIQGPANESVDPGDSASLAATVANDTKNSGVTWSLSGNGCTGGSCGTLSNSTTTAVTYTAPVTVATAFGVTVTATSVADSSVTAMAMLNVPVNPAISTAAGPLSGGTLGTPYAMTLAGLGGIPPNTWAVKTGNLPAGLTLNPSTGAIAGTPMAAGNPSFAVTLTDSGSPALTATSTFSIAVAYPPLTIITTTLPNGMLGTAYTAALSASGGTGTGYTWAVTSGTGLSAVGVSLSSSGAITGIPTASETSVPFTVQVADSAGNTATATLMLTVTSVAFQGRVLSGQQPVSGAMIQIYAAGSTGNGSAATPMLTQTVSTDSAGYFSITGLYTCGQSNTGAAIAGSNQIYMVATGGTTSTTANANNNALAMMAAVGNCSTLNPSTYTYINELTTVAAAWALAPFTTSITNIGASATNTQGITNAFLDAALLANPATGTAATLPTNLTIETGLLNALADALNSCTDSDGGTACTPLFAAATPYNGTTPTDTFTSALNIVKNPGQNVSAVYAAIGANPPYATTHTAAPNDWTMALTVAGGGLASPTSLDIDANGNVWVAGENGELSEFSAQGTPLSGATGYGVGDLYEVYGLTIDTNGFIWVTNEESSPNAFGSVSEFYGSNSSTPGAVVAGNGGTNFYDSTINFPVALAADTNGNIFIDNYAPNSSVTVYNNSGAYVSNLGSGNVAIPVAVAVDSNHGVWIANSGDDTITHSDMNGNILSRPTCCEQANGLATDALGNVWVANYSVSNGGSFSEVAPDGSVLINQSTVGGVQYPAGIHVDAAQNVWIANYRGESITEIAGNGGALTPGTAISPDTGYGYSGPSSASPLLLLPYDVVPDASGNIWVSNNGNNNLVVFFGVAAPTGTPTLPVPVAP
jgi:hypothetical protein